MNIGILDYGVGNLGSLANMIRFINHKPIISSSIKDLTECKIIFIPGVGHFDKAIDRLALNDNISRLKDYGKDSEKHIAGICLGMHILCNSSEEGSVPGLGLLDTNIKSFREAGISQVPHMGWNVVDDSNMPFSLGNQNRFYFCHSFYCPKSESSERSLISTYEIDFTSFLWNKNIIGIQFHPEKSGMNGVNFLKSLLQSI